jgi:hypothetical protein
MEILAVSLEVQAEVYNRRALTITPRKVRH